MSKSKPFTIRLSEEVEGWLERENRRTKLTKVPCSRLWRRSLSALAAFPAWGLGDRSTQGGRG